MSTKTFLYLLAVFMILQRFAIGKDWKKAFEETLPNRKVCRLII
jgi:hypothetical protein